MLQGRATSPSDNHTMFSDEVSHLRWFLLPSEAQSNLAGKPTLIRKCVIKVRQEIKQLTPNDIKERIRVPPHLLNFKPEHAADVMIKQELPLGKKENFRVHPTVCCPLPNANRRQSNQPTSTGKFSFVSPPKRLFKLTVEAIENFNMIEDEDRVLVCLSGGKVGWVGEICCLFFQSERFQDSLSLLHVLHQYQFYSKSKGVSFELGAVTVDPMTSSYDPSPLIPYLKSLKVPYFYERQGE